MTPEQLQQFNVMYQWYKAMQSANSIPLQTDQAIRDRFKNLGAALSVSTRSTGDLSKAVNEGGTGTYSVAKVPNAVLQVNINGTTYYIPVIT